MITKPKQSNLDPLLAYAQAEEKQPVGGERKSLQAFATKVRNLYLRHRPWGDYAQSLGLVVLASILGRPFSPSFDHANLVMFYLLAEVIAAIRFGLGPSIVAALFSVVAFHTFFVLPNFTFAIDQAQYLLTFSGLFVVGLVISTLTARVREQVKMAQRREVQTSVSYDFSRALAAAGELEAITHAIMTHVKKVFNREVVIFLLEGDELSSHALNPGFTLDAHEYAVAAWSCQHGRLAGRGTQILPAANLRYYPLKTARGSVGVLGIQPIDTTDHLTPAQDRLLGIFTSQAAVAIERIQLAEQAQQTQLLRETEKLQTALLNSISHDLRTPLASITGTLSSLREDKDYLDEATQYELVENAWEEAARLNRLVANLLDMTRLQAGGVKVARELCDVQDLIGTALVELANKLQERQVKVTVPDNLPLIPIDFVLISRVLTNLLDNADKYSPPGAPIEIWARVVESGIEIAVADRGVGIPSDELRRVFEKFYRVQRADGASGTGLGLSICQGLIEVHSGHIWAHNRPGGGTIITLRLPLDQMMPTVRTVAQGVS